MQQKLYTAFRPFSSWNVATWFVFSFFIFFMGFAGWGQAPSYSYDATNSRNLDNFSLTIADALNPQAKLNRLIIAVDVNPEGERFVLTFGNGIKRVGDADVLIDFIPNQNNRLSNPLDFAINSEGKFFVATNESNRRFIRVYSPTGVYLSNETLGDGSYGNGLNQFRGPTGLAFDKDDNLYVADHYIGDQNPPIPSFIKIYRKDVSGIYKNNLIKEFNNIQGTLLNFPYRLAVNSQGHLYMAELGQDGNAKVKILQFDTNFNPTQIGESSAITNQTGSPGSIIIDKFDNIFVADLGSELDLSRVLEATNDVNEFYEVFEIIKRGIQNNSFNIKVYNPNNSFNNTISSQIDLPIDLSISKCGTLYVNNAIFDGTITNFFGQRVPNITIDFDLEVYQRSPGYDTENPILVVCPLDQPGTLTNGKFILLDYREKAQFTDTCDKELSLTQTPAPGVEISETTQITITATDDAGNISENCNFFVIIDEGTENNPPIAEPDFYSVWEDNVLEVPAEDGVLKNDTDTDGDDLIAVLERTTDHGVLILRSDGSFTYTPNPNFNGTDRFTYFANDGQVNTTIPVMVEIWVKAVPDVICESSFTLNLDANGNAFLRKTDLYSVDQGNVQFVLDKENFTCADLGENTVTLSFTYTIPEEGQFTESCDIKIIVVDEIKPTISCPANINESIAFGETGRIVSYGLPVFNDNCSGSTIEQTAGLAPGSNFPIGSTTNTFVVTDASENIATCSFTVTIVEEAKVVDATFQNCPANAIIENTSPGECGTIVTFPNPTASDATGSVQVIQKEGPVSGEYFQLGNTEVVFEAIGSNGNKVECRFTVTIIDNEDPVINCPDNIRVDVDPGETTKVVNFQTPSGSDNCGVDPVVQTGGLISGSQFPVGTTKLTFIITDGSGNFTSCSFNVIVNPEIPPGNQAPIAIDDFHTVQQDETLTVNAADGVLSNDEDETPEALTAVLITDVSNGTLQFNSDGSFIYSPNPAFVGIDEFTYVANDGELDSNIATVRIDVTSTVFPNFRPNAINDPYTTPFETTLSVEKPGILGNDTDDDNDDLTAEIRSDVADGILTWNPDGSFTYIPNPGFSGEDSFTYVANDGKEDSNIATVTIQVGDPDVQNPPIALDDNFSIFIDETLDVPAPGILENDSFDAVTSIRFDNNIPNGTLTLNNDGSFIFIPNAGFTGEVSFQYIIMDGSLESNSATVTITVKPRPTQNEAPVANDDFYEIQQGEILVVDAPGILGNDTDANGDVLTASVGSVSATGSFVFNSDGSFKYTPLPGFVGTESFTYVANDGQLNSNIATVTITVTGSSSGDFLCKDELSLQLDANGQATLSALDLYTGNPGDRVFTLSRSSFDCTNIGENSVVLNYTGTDGTGSCIINVRIEDTLPPEIQTQDISISLDSFGFASITAEMLHNGTSDNCGVSQLSLDILNFSCENLGINTVLLTATDASGNSATQTVNVNVTGNCKQIPVKPYEYIFIYPNPTPGPFTFEAPTGWIIEKVDVFDFRGRYITTAAFPAGAPYNMDLSFLQTAVYTLHLTTNQGNKIIRVIIH